MLEWLYEWFVAVVAYILSWFGLDLAKREHTEEVQLAPMPSPSPPVEMEAQPEQ